MGASGNFDQRPPAGQETCPVGRDLRRRYSVLKQAAQTETTAKMSCSHGPLRDAAPLLLHTLREPRPVLRLRVQAAGAALRRAHTRLLLHLLDELPRTWRPCPCAAEAKTSDRARRPRAFCRRLPGRTGPPTRAATHSPGRQSIPPPSFNPFHNRIVHSDKNGQPIAAQSANCRHPAHIRRRFLDCGKVPQIPAPALQSARAQNPVRRRRGCCIKDFRDTSVARAERGYLEDLCRFQRVIIQGSLPHIRAVEDRAFMPF